MSFRDYKELLETLYAENGENTGNHHFVPFPTMFSTYSKQN